MAEVQYTKTLVIETSDGQVTLSQGEAQALVRMLDDNPRYFKVADKDTGVKTYYDINSSACGFCKVATLTPGTTDAEAIPCEDPLPNCPEDTDGGSDGGDGGDDSGDDTPEP